MIEDIVQRENPILRKVAKVMPHKDVSSSSTKELISRMQKILAKEKNGVGLAAPQVGASVRLFIVSAQVFETDDEKHEEKSAPKKNAPDVIFINPHIVRSSRAKKEMAEGCLSVRGLYGTVIRHEKVSVRAQDAEGKVFIRHASGLLAQIIQHEIDHLEGILYTDKAVVLENEERASKRRSALKNKSHE